FSPCASDNKLNNPKSVLSECSCERNSKRSFVGELSNVFVLGTGLSFIFNSGLFPLFHQSLNRFADRFLSNCEPFQMLPGGGIDANGKWKRKIKTDKYLFAVKALSKVFRAKFVALL